MEGGPQMQAATAQAAEADMQMAAVNLTASKEARKRAELDAQLLANRIALLKQEEEKAWKKISETQKRTTEIVSLRQQNEAKFAAKEDFYKEKWGAIRQAQDKNSQRRETARTERDGARNAMLGARNENHAQLKMQSQQILMQKKGREESDRTANQERNQFIREKKEEARRRLEEERLATLDKYREDYESRNAQEEMLRARTDALVAKMEREEMELIQRLQNTQTVQRNAYEELEEALGKTSQQVSASQRGVAPVSPGASGGYPTSAAGSSRGGGVPKGGDMRQPRPAA